MDRRYRGEIREYLESLYSYDISELCWYFGLPVSGTKSEKIHRILKSDAEYQEVKYKIVFMNFAFEMLDYFYSDELSEILEEIDLPVSGTKREKILRIVFSDMINPRELLETRVKDEIDEIYFDLFDDENTSTKRRAVGEILSYFDFVQMEAEERGMEAEMKVERKEPGWDELQKILEMGEGQTVEFKNHKILGNKYEIAKALCAFANRDGGKLLIGVKDDKTLSGMRAKRKDHEDYIRQIARFKCDPPVPINFEVVSESDGDVYVIEVLRKKPRHTPFGIKTKDGGRAYFVRDGTMVVEAHPTELKDIIDG